MAVSWPYLESVPNFEFSKNRVFGEQKFSIFEDFQQKKCFSIVIATVTFNDFCHADMDFYALMHCTGI